jgi:hypothetical protein
MRDFQALVRADHDDLDQALAVLVSPSTPVADLADVLDATRLALAVHVTAQSRVLDRLIARSDPTPAALRAIVLRTRRDHAEQQLLVEYLAGMRPATCDWYERALELRSLLLDHAWHEHISRSLAPHVAQPAVDALAAEYATERLRVLATTSPTALAHALLVG